MTTQIISIACGFKHTLFLRKDGKVLAIGDNRGGALGIGYSPGQYKFSTPQIIPNLSNVVQIVAAGGNSYFLTRDGKVYRCGENENGTLDNDSSNTTFRSIFEPTEYKNLTDVVQIAASNMYFVALKSDGTVVLKGLVVRLLSTGLDNMKNIVQIAVSDFNIDLLDSNRILFSFGLGMDKYTQINGPFIGIYSYSQRDITGGENRNSLIRIGVLEDKRLVFLSGIQIFKDNIDRYPRDFTKLDISWNTITFSIDRGLEIFNYDLSTRQLTSDMEPDALYYHKDYSTFFLYRDGKVLTEEDGDLKEIEF